MLSVFVSAHGYGSLTGDFGTAGAALQHDCGTGGAIFLC